MADGGDDLPVARPERVAETQLYRCPGFKLAIAIEGDAERADVMAHRREVVRFIDQGHLDYRLTLHPGGASVLAVVRRDDVTEQLGAVKFLVGLLDELFTVFVPAVREGKAAADGQVLAVEQVLPLEVCLLDDLADPLGDRVGLVVADIVEENGEFLPAVAGGNIAFADAVQQDFRDLLQGPVPRQVAAAIVVLLEMVEIEQQDGAVRRFVRAPLTAELFEECLEVGLIVEPGQAVADRGIFDIRQQVGFQYAGVFQLAGDMVQVVEQGRSQCRIDPVGHQDFFPVH